VRTSAHLICVSLLAVLAACNGSEGANPEETAPPPSRVSSTVDTELAETTSPPAPTEPSVTETSEQSTTIETPAPTDVETSTTVANGGGFLPRNSAHESTPCPA